jgi:hypothetical protein
MELQENKIYTSAELAEWFKITPKTFSNTRIKRLEILKDYCSFEDLGRKGILIKDVYIFEYKGKASARVKQLFDEMWGYQGENIDRGTKVAEKMFRQEKFDIKLSTLKNYVNQERKRRYGKISSKKHPQESGKDGSCRFIFCKITPSGEMLHFNNLEMKIIKDIRKKYNFGEETEEYQAFREAYQSGEITQEEWADYTENYEKDKWDEYCAEVAHNIESFVGFGVQVEKREEDWRVDF